MNSILLDQLNDAQQQAVTYPEGNLLVLAGAGSGKTRVLVHRIAWLVQHGISINHILAVTFTNKAAAEMRERLEQMLNLPLNQMWVGTFHGLAHRLLRIHWQEAGLTESFQIIDSEDQLRLLKRLHKNLNLDIEQWPAKQSQSFINSHKDRGLRSQQVRINNFVDETLQKIYQTYEQTCQQSGLVDFAELLLRSYELWQKNQLILEHYQQRFKHILIDEFQDTNSIQYAWIKMIAQNNTSLTAVGDDDQSIYSWRGADFTNMHRLSKDYPNLQMIRLEQNYRSTATILSAANAVIANNNNRLGKKLWTQGKPGDLITLYSAFNEIDEARYIVDKIRTWYAHGNKLSEVAILYRSNAQSRTIEEQLLQANIAYRIYGGLRFFERAEIKDALAYLRLLANQDDDAAFERIINVPTRGIGEATIIVLRNHARQHHLSLFASAGVVTTTNQLPSRAANAVSSFLTMITNTAKQIATLELHDLVSLVIRVSNLHLHYEKNNIANRQSRIENLDELVTAAQQFATTIAEKDQKLLLNSFLAHAALETGERTEGETDDCVQLMTLHAAKGLEFPLVFLCGMEEGLFPHIMSMETDDGLEEERRLCYVGMTRAMQKLYLLNAESRRLHGTTSFRRPSRFLQEIPRELISEDSLLTNIVRPTIAFQSKPQPITTKPTLPTSQTVIGGLKLGQRVKHEIFGEGVITAFEGNDTQLLVQINFIRKGSKWLSPTYAKLQPL